MVADGSKLFDSTKDLNVPAMMSLAILSAPTPENALLMVTVRFVMLFRVCCSPNVELARFKASEHHSNDCCRCST
eukprot:9367654-Pyramimonas_sp.AAC.1